MSLKENISCKSFENRIHQTLDNRQSLFEDAQLCAHAAICQPCAQRLRSYALLSDPGEPLFATAQPQLKQGFAASVVAAVVADPPPENSDAKPVSRAQHAADLPEISLRDSVWQRPAWLVTVGACVAVLMLLLFSQTLIPRTEPSHIAMPEIPLAIDGEGAVPYDLIIAQLSMIDEEAIEKTIDQTIQSADVPAGFRPITSSLGVAFDLLRGAIPGAGGRPKPQAQTIRQHPGLYLA